MNYQQACEYLQQTKSRGAKLGLERMTELLCRLDNPQEKIRAVHIAGTNGKGSVGVMLSAVLTETGLKTGHFSSPALLSVREYFRINQNLIAEQDFAELLSEVAFHAEQMQDKPTEFEILSAMAFQYFAEQHCQIAVIECCMGGDTDCTNMMKQPLLSVITNIQKDHSAFLGDTLPEIAQHKAGIIKNGCPVLFGSSGEETAVQVILDKAKECHAPVFRPEFLPYHLEFTFDGMDFSCVPFGRLHSALSGSYQEENISLVLTAVQILRKQGILIPDSAIRDGFRHCRWKGRFELLQKEPPVFFDGGHNPDGIAKTAETIQRMLAGYQVLFIMGVMKDKDYEKMSELLAPLGKAFFTVAPENARALSPERLAETLKRHHAEEVTACDSVGEAVRKAFVKAETLGKPVIFGVGSLYLYREFSETLKKL